MSDNESQQSVEAPKIKKVKEKKPRSQAQMDNMKKAMAALKAKREQRDKDEIEARKIKETDIATAKEQLRLAKQAEKDAKRVERKKTLPPAMEYMTKTHFQNEMNAFKDAIIQALPKEVFRDVERIVEKPVEKLVVVPKTIVREKAVPVPQLLTGSALLDKLYFNK
jgi:hypothetical protein